MPAPEAVARGFARWWDEWLAEDVRLLVVSDVPTYPASLPECVAESPKDIDPCAEPRDRVTWPDPIMIAAERYSDPDLVALDLIPVLCDEDDCHAVIGSMITHRDSGHLWAGFALTLAPILAPAIVELVPDAFR